MEDTAVITIVSLICLAILVIVALLQGHNSYMIYLAIFVFSTAAGVMLPQPGWFKGGE